MAAMGVWHYVENGRARGPVELPALQGLIAGGALSPDALVWQPGMSNWVPARAIPELAASIPAVTPPPITAPPPVPPISPILVDDATDIAQNKVLAALAYFGPLVVVPLLAAPNSKFARFHCNQALALFLSFLVVYCALWLISVIPFLLCLLWPLHFACWFAGFFLMIMGVINAAHGEFKALPWVGHYRVLN